MFKVGKPAKFILDSKSTTSPQHIVYLIMVRPYYLKEYLKAELKKHTYFGVSESEIANEPLDWMMCGGYFKIGIKEPWMDLMMSSP